MDVDLAPDTTLGASVLAGVLLAFALDFDPGAVDQEVQRALGPAIADPTNGDDCSAPTFQRG